jgi:mannose-1-phosphate guanylyltransferase
MSANTASLWGIILAGGEGERLKGFVREQFGSTIPKQFCAFVGRRSMLERTIRRARLLISSERLVVVGTAHHGSHICRNLGTPPPSTVLLQPTDRDTLPGIVLSLIHILRKDPDAVAAILPADHFILPGHRFMHAVSAAAQFLTDKNVDCPILLAVKPDRPEPEHGWIKPGEVVEHDDRRTIRRITRFAEKPPRDRAEQLMKDGWLWNTTAVIVRARSLMDLVRRHAPDLAARFTLLQRFLGSSREQDFIEEVYHAIPKINFPVSVMADRDMRSLVLPIQDVYWSDWETKERILDTAMAFGLSPPVPVQPSHDPVMIPP